MLREKVRNGVVVAALVLVAVLLGGCVSQPASERKETLRIEGSTTVFPIAQKAAEAYMNKNKNADIQVSATGSGAGITAVGQGRAGIGMSSREIKSSEIATYPDLRTVTVAKDGIALIVHKSNSVSALNLSQIRGIYNGTIKNWNQVGGADASIVVIGRDAASGTREFFWEHVMSKENFTEGMLEKNSNAAIKESVMSTPGSIGYVGLGYVDSSVKALKISTSAGDVEASVANVLNGTYPISRSLYFITKGEPRGLAKKFIEFVLSAQGQKIVQDEGFVPIK
ncbi:MAG: phosphate ABC transporter substrate-binding protein [Thermoplasmata archaeon]